MADSRFNQLCLNCGLCCNGVIFARGQLQPADDRERLRALGLKLVRNTGRSGPRKFHQPCEALDGCRCGIYSKRPQYCREFKCSLLASLEGGEIGFETARAVVTNALRRVAKVRRLLKALGDEHEDLPLATRFRRVQKQFENGTPTSEETICYGELTLAMHGLNVFLSEKFYPG